jgi:hypothetical protein
MGAAAGWHATVVVAARVTTQPTHGAASSGNKRATLQMRAVRLLLLCCRAVSVFIVDIDMNIDVSGLPCALNKRLNNPYIHIVPDEPR